MMAGFLGKQAEILCDNCKKHHMDIASGQTSLVGKAALIKSHQLQ